MVLLSALETNVGIHLKIQNVDVIPSAIHSGLQSPIYFIIYNIEVSIVSLIADLSTSLTYLNSRSDRRRKDGGEQAYSKEAAHLQTLEDDKYSKK